MNAAVMKAIGEMAIEHVPEPQVGPGELLIEVKACAICGSDVRTFWHGSAHVTPPRILGHEVAGVIKAVGPGLSGYSPGEAVTVAPAIGCGICEYCRAGATNMCPDLETIGFEFDGGFAEAMVVPAKAVRQGHVNSIPEGLSFEEAALAEPLACCINGQQFLGIGIGQDVAVIGAGVIGLFHTELALLKGASRVFLIDVVPERLEYAKVFGDRVFPIDGGKVDPVREVLSQTKGRGVDVAIVACPVGTAQNQALEMAARRGRVSLFGGLPQGKSTGHLDSNLIHYKELGVFGAHASTASQNRLALKLIAEGKINARRYITHTYPLSKIVEGMQAVREGKALKVIIQPTR